MRNGFDAEFEITNIIDDIRHYFATNGSKDTKAIIGISAGKYSSKSSSASEISLISRTVSVS